MPRAPQPLSLLVLLVLAATAWGQAGPGPKELQPWLIGLTAAVVFLFAVFVLLLGRRLRQLGTCRRERGGCATPAAEDGGEESDGGARGRATSL